MIRLLLTLALSSNGWSQTSKTTPAATPGSSPVKSSASPKSGVSTEIFEKEESSADDSSGLKTLNAKVKVVRDDGEGREVFFSSPKVTGAFYLRRSVEHYGRYLKILEDSKKPQGAAVTIRYDENQNIKSIEGNTSKAPQDSDEKWEFVEPSE